MLTQKEYIQKSLETNLFFLRLAKEHAIFALAGIPATYGEIINQLLEQKNTLEGLLKNAVKLANGVISQEVLEANELVTEMTLDSEEKTQQLIRIPIDTEITKMELALKPVGEEINNPKLVEQVFALNQQAITALNKALLAYEQFLNETLKCNVASNLYPTIIHHIIDETRFFSTLIQKIQSNQDITIMNNSIMQEFNLNWNDIMKEHSEFIRGHLDPTETELFNTANAFVNAFTQIEDNTSLLNTNPQYSAQVYKDTVLATTSLRNFKSLETEAILTCNVKTISLPLFADHVTRESNHYLRLLKSLMTSE